MSEEKGIEALKLQERAVRRPDFCQFLHQLKARNPDGKVAIYLDSLSVHLSSKVAKLRDKLGFTFIRSPIYCPEANPIEFAFSQCKRQFKKLKLQLISKGEPIDMKHLICTAFKCVTK